MKVSLGSGSEPLAETEAMDYNGFLVLSWREAWD
jgi:hypothetical protein